MSGSVGSPQAIAAAVLFRPSDQTTSGSSDLGDLGQGCTRDWKSSARPSVSGKRTGIPIRKTGSKARELARMGRSLDYWLTLNQRVQGSSPGRPTNKIGASQSAAPRCFQPGQAPQCFHMRA